ncbi:hypothetical protein PIB30_093821 [Stylosanthes scabra]|uniref:Uncharacterized protein n=1 Tax=Stylosanthes scabra TaxID=79078 RepID=A0ABU6UXM9_9FABA|nr:hypothetical protein [Stylosanthes scabra]
MPMTIASSHIRQGSSARNAPLNTSAGIGMPARRNPSCDGRMPQEGAQVWGYPPRPHKLSPGVMSSEHSTCLSIYPFRSEWFLVSQGTSPRCRFHHNEASIR